MENLVEVYWECMAGIGMELNTVLVVVVVEDQIMVTEDLAHVMESDSSQPEI